jgi:hypothetical protein
MGGKKIFNIMAINQIKLFIGHVRNNDDTGKLLLSELEYVQLIAGIQHPVLNKSTPTNFLKWTPSCWITNFKIILTHIEGETKIANQWIPSTQRKKDTFLMESFFKYTQDTHTLQILNNCRLYLQIFTLSDITSADGKKLTKSQLNGHRSPSFSTELSWPKQIKPSRKCWETFKHVIKYIFCHKNSFTLKKPLGPWKPTIHPQNTWNHFYDPEKKTTNKI